MFVTVHDISHVALADGNLANAGLAAEDKANTAETAINR
jgi:hypothetical protein